MKTEDKTISRRTLLNGAAMIVGGALSSAIPSLAQHATNAVEGVAPNLSFDPVLVSPIAKILETTSEGAIKFSSEFLSNKVFQDVPLAFGAAKPPRIDGKLLEIGSLVQPNGDFLFRIYAPKAKEVTLKLSITRGGTDLTLEKKEDGTFEGLLPYDENHTGPVNVDVYIDGTDSLYPFIPIQWAGNAPHNFIEIPDADLDFLLIKDVPHGAMSREIYWADSVKSWVRCILYTPPGYMKANKEYPVLYLQHGLGDNETTWEYGAKVAHILDNLIAEGKTQPFIVVMNNAMIRYPSNIGPGIDEAFERMLIESCIPYIERTYRTKTGKWNRAIGGLSMGSYMSCDIAFRHPEVFGSLGTFTASMTSDATQEALRTTYVRPFPTVMKDAAKFRSDYKVYFRSTTPAEDHFDYFLADDMICADGGIDKLPSYHRIVYPKRTAKWNSWRMGIRDYAQLLFR